MFPYVTLLQCRPGLFISKKGEIGFKTEHKTASLNSPGYFQVDAYDLCGKHFGGGLCDPILRDGIMVTPVHPKELRAFIDRSRGTVVIDDPNQDGSEAGSWEQAIKDAEQMKSKAETP